MYEQTRSRLNALISEMGQDSSALKALYLKLRDPDTVSAVHYQLTLDLLVTAVENVVRHKRSFAQSRRYYSDSASTKNLLGMEKRRDSLENHRLVLEYRIGLLTAILSGDPYTNRYTGETNAN